ncbi:hypothetical protein FB45DRAFT_1036645 [Roridomyces roridus]|uniref:Uncharacterized protein n=1 Tax=Roridomyces roridus TaxID=1738132 RepID=A0AAD7FD65_9AGAR|nr:hypothetical protein FB45DRAFT_1036645 [Roridomyces roridus]
MSTSTRQSQAQLNDELILVLVKMGVCMECDRLKLDCCIQGASVRLKEDIIAIGDTHT